MRIIEAKNYEDMSKKAAEIIAAQILLKPDAVLGLATGSTPVGTYQNLIKKYEAGELDFSQVSSVNLDEYKGLSGDHDQSYRYFMNENLFNHVNIDKSRTSVPNGLEEDAAKACADYDAVIAAAGGVDLQLLGIGGNGHIGFNEPDKAFEQTTHCVTLEENTRTANARFFSNIDEVPTHAITMGIKTIMQAKQIVLAVSGADKAEILKKVLTGPVTPGIPGSILQMHPDVIVVADEAALSQL